MRDAAPQSQSQTIYLKDYRAPAYLVDQVDLTFRLDPTATRVISRIAFRPNPEAPGPFTLDGETMTLISASIDGTPVSPTVSDTGLTCDVPNAPFVWEAEVEINPSANTALEGLYMSNGMYCTQCEAEGFRKITYYPDRPDVLAPFKVRIEGSEPVLLSNGNRTALGEGFAEWDDPWPKPAYLFALVAGDLHATSDSFTTMEGREVALNIYVRDGDQDKTAFAMEALKLSMKWDQDVYGRAYDLDIFNIVAVDDFNMGAMENKGLNIFNSSAVLAHPDTTTDGNFERIEAIIAHEYFHNWTGNRITCRDWFQLCLKEGLTVYRDQQFTSDVRGAATKRISDVITLRAAQFPEDNGPLAHPVRPASFVEINNFYTATVYEKGAEIIGMLRTIVGPEAYAKALDLYFDRHDGQACTIEDWIKVFEDTTGRDLGHFAQWYAQAGTPRVTVKQDYSGDTLTLTFSQSTPPTPGQDNKSPLVIPIAFGLIEADGSQSLPTTLLELTQDEQTITLQREGAGWISSDLHLSEKTPGVRGLAPAQPSGTAPTASLLRGFSAPIILTSDQNDADRAHLLAHDTDPFTRWEAGRSLAKSTLISMITEGTPPRTSFLDGLAAVARDDTLDPDFRSFALGLPSDNDIAQSLADAGHTPDPQAVYDARETLATAIAQHMQDVTPRLYAQNQVPGPYSPNPEAIGKRALANTMLALITRLDGGAQARAQYGAQENMTQVLAALNALVRQGIAKDELADFYARWSHERLVVNKWFGLQSGGARPEDAATVTATLAEHPDFDIKNPNRFRALFGGMVGNTAGFHHASGAGYNLLVDWLIKLDDLNPQTTARMTTAFNAIARYDADRQSLAKEALGRLQAKPGLSRDTGEMVARLLSA
ncbi:aminopeptidase N [Shimia ponticola]|uniref:aminopeptidase N n=1 Tax=Shimia ponticola TaxID=2582893 RepID=UPI0011BF2794|nr:aminopeptidase N [Shimia ponticola]